MSGSFDVNRLKEKFNALNSTQDSIQTLSLWILHHKAHCEKIVETWLKYFKKCDANQKLNMFYLANDIIQNSKKRNARIFLSLFKRALIEAVFNIKDHNVKPTIQRILNILKERKFFDKVYIEDLIKALNITKDKEQISVSTIKTGNTNASKIDKSLIENFKPKCFFDEISKMSQIINDLYLSEKNIKAIIDQFNYPNEEWVNQFKDKLSGREMDSDFASASLKLEGFIGLLTTCKKDREHFVEQIKVANAFYNNMWEDTKFVTSAYRKYNNRLDGVKKKLIEKNENKTKSNTNDIDSNDLSQNTTTKIQKDILQSITAFVEQMKKKDEPNEIQGTKDVDMRNNEQNHMADNDTSTTDVDFRKLFPMMNDGSLSAQHPNNVSNNIDDENSGADIFKNILKTLKTVQSKDSNNPLDFDKYSKPLMSTDNNNNNTSNYCEENIVGSSMTAISKTTKIMNEVHQGENMELGYEDDDEVSIVGEKSAAFHRHSNVTKRLDQIPAVSNTPPRYADTVSLTKDSDLRHADLPQEVANIPPPSFFSLTSSSNLIGTTTVLHGPNGSSSSSPHVPNILLLLPPPPPPPFTILPPTIIPPSSASDSRGSGGPFDFGKTPSICSGSGSLGGSVTPSLLPPLIDTNLTPSPDPVHRQNAKYFALTQMYEQKKTDPSSPFSDNNNDEDAFLTTKPLDILTKLIGLKSNSFGSALSNDPNKQQFPSPSVGGQTFFTAPFFNSSNFPVASPSAGNNVMMRTPGFTKSSMAAGPAGSYDEEKSVFTGSFYDPPSSFSALNNNHPSSDSPSPVIDQFELGVGGMPTESERGERGTWINDEIITGGSNSEYYDVDLYRSEHFLLHPPPPTTTTNINTMFDDVGGKGRTESADTSSLSSVVCESVATAAANTTYQLSPLTTLSNSNDSSHWERIDFPFENYEDQHSTAAVVGVTTTLSIITTTTSGYRFPKYHQSMPRMFRSYNNNTPTSNFRPPIMDYPPRRYHHSFYHRLPPSVPTQGQQRLTAFPGGKSPMVMMRHFNRLPPRHQTNPRNNNNFLPPHLSASTTLSSASGGNGAFPNFSSLSSSNIPRSNPSSVHNPNLKVIIGRK